MVTRTVFRTSGVEEQVDIGAGFKGYNAAIGAQWGELVRLADGRALWVDEEGLLRGREWNRLATLLSGRYIVGDAIVLLAEDLRSK